MLESALVLLFFVAIIFMIYSAKKKIAAHIQAVNLIKSEIADVSKMTAKIGAFADGNQTTNIIAVSEELSGFFYSKVIESIATEKFSFPLDRVIQVKLYVNGQNMPIEKPKVNVSPVAYAQELSTADKTASEIRSISITRSISLELTYIFNNSQKILPISIVNMPNEAERSQMHKIYSNAIWWAAFLYAAIVIARDDHAVGKERFTSDIAASFSNNFSGHFEQEAPVEKPYETSVSVKHSGDERY